MRIVQSQEFKQEIAQGLVVVDFFATWCGPCKMLAPVLEEVAGEMSGQVKIIKVDIDQSLDLARAYQVASVPTMIVFKDGQPVHKMVGFMPKEQIKEQIKEQVSE